MVPFFPVSPPPQTPPDLPQQHKDEILQKSPTPKQKLEEGGGEDHRAEAKERRSGTDPTTHHSKDPSNGWVPCEQMKKKRCCMFSTPIPKQVEVEAMEVKGEQGEENEDDEKKSARDLCSKRSWSMKCGSAEAGSRPSSSSRDEGARWQEGKSAFPFKKRKVHHQWAKETIIGKEKTIKTKLKRTMTPKKLGEEEVEEEVAEDEEDRMEDDKSNVKKKWGSNGSVVMEGSRCSRVNGRGWRCCQQTLVGYSLCEHHLGKGRLRSMSSVRGCASPTLNNNRDEGDYDDGLLSFPPKMMHEVEDKAVGDEKEEEEDDEKLTSMVMNKRTKKKSGILKARSISSLLGETHLAATATLVPSNPLV
ncbi:hypothetical protein MRB53_008648 [Persea americana]|uniref:Uncharacterized protein n=1 Tax=Persea americana TaxID=3435 RepID=A0ACC2MMG1_PERAE|nr:hypothetical protein MRB53_008648 [Persea americana]